MTFKKKLLLGLGTLAAIATPFVAVVSCGSEDKTKDEENKDSSTEDKTTGQGTNNAGGSGNEGDENVGSGNGAGNGDGAEVVSHDLSAAWVAADGHEVGSYHFWVPSEEWTVGAVAVEQEYTKMFNVADDYLTGNTIGTMRTFENKENTLMVSGAGQYDMNVEGQNLQGVRDFITAVQGRGHRLILTERVSSFDQDHYVPVAVDERHPEHTWYLAEVDGYGNAAPVQAPAAVEGAQWTESIIQGFGGHGNVPASYTAGGVATPGDWAKAFVPDADQTGDLIGQYYYSSSSLTKVYADTFTGTLGAHDNVVDAADLPAVRALITKATSANHLMAAIEVQGTNLDSIPDAYRTHFFTSTTSGGQSYEWELVELDQSSQA